MATAGRREKIQGSTITPSAPRPNDRTTYNQALAGRRRRARPASAYAAINHAAIAGAGARPAGRSRTTRPPPRGGVAGGVHSSRRGHQSFGMTQQFTAQNPANTTLILRLLAPARSASSEFLKQQFSIQAKVAQKRVFV
jgi:hypothetical protein